MAMSSDSKLENTGSNPVQPANGRIVAYAELLKLHRRAITYEGYQEGLDDVSIGDRLTNLRSLMSDEEVILAKKLSIQL